VRQSCRPKIPGCQEESSETVSETRATPKRNLTWLRSHELYQIVSGAAHDQFAVLGSPSSSVFVPGSLRLRLFLG
jgi:hypothetical protein